MGTTGANKSSSRVLSDMGLSAADQARMDALIAEEENAPLRAGEFVRNQEETGTTARNKSFDQIQNEVSQLQELPAGTQIEREIDGEWITFTAHDQARMGRNGRMLRRRVYSVVGPGTRRLPLSVTSTTDPYYVAEGRWRRKE